MKRQLFQVFSIAVAAQLLTGGSCADLGPEPKPHECDVVPQYNWPDPQYSTFEVGNPAKCPFKTFGPVINAPFGADGSFRAADVSYNYIRVEFKNLYGTLVGFVNGGSWGYGPNNTYTLSVTSTYNAANGGQPHAVDADTAETYIYRTFGQYGRADGILSYTFGDPNQAVVVAPSGMLPYTNFTVQGEVRDFFMTGPMTYQWFRNGVDIGINATSFQANAGEMGTTQEWYFVATDQTTGRVATGFATSLTKNCNYEGCNDQ